MFKTEVGKAMRKIRGIRNENLVTLSEKYGISVASLSAIEVGKEVIPDDFLVKITKIYALDTNEYIELENAINEDRQSYIYSFPSDANQNGEMAKVFARKINKVNQQSLEKLRKVLEASE